MENESYCMNIDNLGKIYVKDMIIFYDEPLVFSCINEYGNLFIANNSDDDDEKREWIFLPISEARLIKGLKGNISAYDLFANPEGDFIWKVYEYFDERISNAIQISSSDLTDDYLPDKRAFYEIYDETNLAKYDNEIVEISKKERREVLDLALEPYYSHVHEISCDLFSKILNDVQSTLYYIASKNGDEPSEKTKSENRLNATLTFAASFGVRLKSDELVDVLGVSKFQENLKLLMELLDSKGDYDKIKAILNVISPKAALKYKKLLKTLLNNEMGLKSYCAFPNNYYSHVSLCKSDIEKSLLIFESEVSSKIRVIEEYGKLVGINVYQRTFDFINNNDERINGTIDSNIDIDEYRLPKYVKVNIEELIEYNDITQKEIFKYKLCKLDYLDHNDEIA